MTNSYSFCFPVAVLMAVACAGPGSSGHSSDPGSNSPTSGQASSSEEQAALYRKWWRSFVEASPTWPEEREQWLSRGPRERQFLLELLLRELVTGNQTLSETGRAPPPWKRSIDEFRYLGSEAVPPLTESVKLLAGGHPVDWVAVQRLGAALGMVAEATEVADLLLGDASRTLRFATTRVLVAMSQPSSVDILCKIAIEDADWQVRAAAVDGLAYWAAQVDAGTPSAFSRDALVLALGDPDSYVRKRACWALAPVQLRTVQFALVDRLEAANQSGEVELAELLHASLRQSTGKLEVPRRAASWRNALEVEDG